MTPDVGVVAIPVDVATAPGISAAVVGTRIDAIVGFGVALARSVAVPTTPVRTSFRGDPNWEAPAIGSGVVVTEMTVAVTDDQAVGESGVGEATTSARVAVDVKVKAVTMTTTTARRPSHHELCMNWIVRPQFRWVAKSMLSEEFGVCPG